MYGGAPLCGRGSGFFFGAAATELGRGGSGGGFFFFSRLVCRSAVRGVKGNISKVKSVGHEERAVEEAKGREGH